MLVVPIAYTQFPRFAAEAVTPYRAHPFYFSELDEDTGLNVQAADELAEFAGRNCYKSWNRPNPKTATNAGYLKNIIDQGHFSVLEHASVTFFVEGVSRALLTELTRHRFLSFSVVSQRYVRHSRQEFVIPPAIDENLDTVGGVFEEAIDDAFDAYETLVGALLAKGLPKKEALEAARSVLPNAAETSFVVTGNLRCWRDVLGKRYHPAADREIRAFAGEVLKHLRLIAPNSVQDIEDIP